MFPKQALRNYLAEDSLVSTLRTSSCGKEIKVGDGVQGLCSSLKYFLKILGTENDHQHGLTEVKVLSPQPVTMSLASEMKEDVGEIAFLTSLLVTRNYLPTLSCPPGKKSR